MNRRQFKGSQFIYHSSCRPMHELIGKSGWQDKNRKGLSYAPDTSALYEFQRHIWLRFNEVHLCLGYTEIRIPNSWLFGTFPADFCQVFLQNLSQNSEQKQKLNSKSLPNTSFFLNMYWNFAKKILEPWHLSFFLKERSIWRTFGI